MSSLLTSKFHSTRVVWLSSLLTLLLQRTPAARVLVAFESLDSGSAGQILRAAFPVVFAAGAVNTLTGATQLITTPASPASGKVGVKFSGMTFGVSGVGTTPESYTIVGILPSGLGVTGATGAAGNLKLVASAGAISGTPAESGTFTVTIAGFDNNNFTGTSVSSDITLIIAANNSPPAFGTQPQPVTADFGATATFTVAVSGSPTPTLQWRKGGAPIAGQTSSTLTLSSLTLSDAGSYDCVATNTVSSTTSSAAALTVTLPPIPTISGQPVAMISRQGSGAFFSVQAAGLALAYQWQKGGVDIPGATLPTLFLNNVQSTDAGDYSASVSNPGGSIASDAAALTVTATGAARFVNLSTRAQVGTGSDILIPGFVIAGSGSKTLLVRAVGPRLGMQPFNVGGTLADPSLSVVAGGATQAANDDWGSFADQTALADATNSSGAFSLAGSTKDAALVVTLPTAAYTAPTFGVGSTSGVALVELYDMDPAGSSTRLANISARARVGTGGDLLIPGFVIEGNVSLTILIRAVGPTLGSPPFNVGGVLQDPVMTIFRGGTIVATNDNWEEAPNQSALIAATTATGAFSLGAGQKDSAFLVSLQPGSYTVQVAGKNGTTGVALMELYLVGP